MADTTIVKPVGGKSVEEVALRLMEIIAHVEDKRLVRVGSNGAPLSPEIIADRKWILDTFAECLTAARGIRST